MNKLFVFALAANAVVLSSCSPTLISKKVNPTDIAFTSEYSDKSFQGLFKQSCGVPGCKPVQRYNLYSRWVVIDISEQAKPAIPAQNIDFNNITIKKANTKVKENKPNDKQQKEPKKEVPKPNVKISTFDKVIGSFDVLYNDSYWYSDKVTSIGVDENGFLTTSEANETSDIPGIGSDIGSTIGPILRGAMANASPPQDSENAMPTGGNVILANSAANVKSVPAHWQQSELSAMPLFTVVPAVYIKDTSMPFVKIGENQENSDSDKPKPVDSDSGKQKSENSDAQVSPHFYVKFEVCSPWEIPVQNPKDCDNNYNSSLFCANVRLKNFHDNYHSEEEKKKYKLIIDNQLTIRMPDENKCFTIDPEIANGNLKEIIKLNAHKHAPKVKLDDALKDALNHAPKDNINHALQDALFYVKAEDSDESCKDQLFDVKDKDCYKELDGLLAFYPKSSYVLVYNCQNADQKADKCPAYPPQKPGQDEIWNIRPFIPPIQSQQITEPTHLHLIKQDRDLFTSPNITLTLNRGMQTAYKYSDTGAIKGFFDMITAPIRSLFPQQTSAGVIHKTTIQIQGGKPTGVTNETDTTN